MNKRKHAFTLIILMLGLSAAAQEEASEKDMKFFEKRKAKKLEIRTHQTRYEMTGTFAMIDLAYDSKISNNVYNGIGIGIQLGSTIFDPRFVRITQVDLKASAQSGPDAFSQYQPRMVGIESWMKWLTDSTKTYRMAVGGGYRYGYTARINPSLGNSTYTHDIFISAVGSFYIDKALEFRNQSVLFDFKADLDLLSYINRHPGYSVIGTFDNYLRPAGGFTNISTTIGATIPRSKFTKENKMRIHYSWGAYGMSEYDRTMKLRVAYHKLGITYFFKY